jgi:hypothetical protein
LLEPAIDAQTFISHLHAVRNSIGSGDRFVPGISDQAMPDALYDRIALMPPFFGRR